MAVREVRESGMMSILWGEVGVGDAPNEARNVDSNFSSFPAPICPKISWRLKDFAPKNVSTETVA